MKFFILLLTVLVFSSQAQPPKDIDAYDSLGVTPLLHAIQEKNLEIVKQNLNLGADPNKAMRDGLKGTPLMYAVAYNQPEIARALLANGAEIDAVDINNDPAINWATYYGHIDAIKLLIDEEADLNIQSKHGDAVDVAYRLWHSDSVAALFRAFFEPEYDASEGKLVEAVRNGESDIVRKLLKKKGNPNLSDQLNIPLIHIAAERGDVETMKILVNAGADISQLNRVGQSVLAIAARHRHEELVSYLISIGADPNLAGTKYLLTPLIGAAVGGNLNIVNQLIDADAVLETYDVINNGTAAHWAMSFGHSDIVIRLLDEGMDYNKKDPGGNYSLKDLADFYQNIAVIEKIDSIERAKNPLLGSWKIKAIHYIYADTTYKVPMDYEGRLIVSDESYSIMYNPYGNERKSAKTLSKLTDEEIKYAFQTLAFNSGKYKIEKGDFITTADIAKVAGFEGGVQHYRMELNKSQSSITMHDETYPSGDKPEWYGKLEIKIIIVRE